MLAPHFDVILNNPGINEAVAAVAAAATRALTACEFAFVWRRLSETLRDRPTRAGFLAAGAIRSSHRDLTVAQLASAHGVDRRTITRWAHREGFSSARALLQACRSWRAVLLARTSGNTARQIADALSFSSAVALRIVVRRVTGHSLTTMRHTSDYGAATCSGARLLPHSAH